MAFLKFWKRKKKEPKKGEGEFSFLSDFKKEKREPHPFEAEGPKPKPEERPLPPKPEEQKPKQTMLKRLREKLFPPKQEARPLPPKPEEKPQPLKPEPPKPEPPKPEEPKPEEKPQPLKPEQILLKRFEEKHFPPKPEPPKPEEPKPEPPKPEPEKPEEPKPEEKPKLSYKSVMENVFDKKKKLLVRKPRTKFIKPVLIIAILTIFLAGLLIKIVPKYTPDIISWIKGIPPEEAVITPEERAVEEEVAVRTYRVLKTDFMDILPAMGTVKGDKEIELRFSMNGTIDSINFFEGDMIKKGDIIATLDQKDALLKLEYAKSKLKTSEVRKMAAKKKLQIHQKLYGQGIIIRPKLEEVRLEYEDVKTQVESSQKEVDFALSELDKTYLYAPADGVMGTRDVEVGEFVTSNIKIASIYYVDYVLVEFGIIEKDVNRIALGQEAKINVDTYPGIDFMGNIDNVAPIIEGRSRTLTVRVRIKNDNPKGTLLPGMFTRVWVTVYEKKNTIKVPADSLYDLDGDGELDSVYAVDEENTAHAKPIKIGYVTSDFIEITDGLEEGEQVVTEAMAELKDKAKVDVIEVQEAIF